MFVRQTNFHHIILRSRLLGFLMGHNIQFFWKLRSKKAERTTSQWILNSVILLEQWGDTTWLMNWKDLNETSCLYVVYLCFLHYFCIIKTLKPIKWFNQTAISTFITNYYSFWIKWCLGIAVQKSNLNTLKFP